MRSDTLNIKARVTMRTNPHPEGNTPKIIPEVTNEDEDNYRTPIGSIA
jgi:hypothetical protein